MYPPFGGVAGENIVRVHLLVMESSANVIGDWRLEHSSPISPKYVAEAEH